MADEFFGAVTGLERGHALVTSAHAIIKMYDGQLRGVHIGCDEPIVYELKTVRSAVDWMEKWKMNLWPSAAEITRQIPMDMDEVDYCIRILLSGFDKQAVEG
ncbi:hypothetical protein HZC53_04745 [Candidatus Uhrbacteria bacterium]|nr:hypothetical protein [Candidatus Uhrbacteria bacterium]